MSAIEVKYLTKFYGSTKALDGINFNLEKGEVLAFLGPNGAGKSTTMKIITCYLEPTKGIVKVNGIDVRENPLKVKEMIGYLPESTPLYEEISVYDFLKFAGKVHNIPKDKLVGRIKEMSDVCGLNEVITKKIGFLSKGYRQRVGIAYAMLHDPDILILDEPTSGLDPNQIIEIRNLIKDLGKSKSIILSTHILSEAEATAQRAIIINKGTLIADGTVSEIKAQNIGDGKSYSIVFKNENLDENTVRTTLKGIKEVAEVIINPSNDIWNIEIETNSQDNIADQLFELCKNQNYKVLEIKEKEVSLEEIFIHLTRKEAVR